MTTFRYYVESGRRNMAGRRQGRRLVAMVTSSASARSRALWRMLAVFAVFALLGAGCSSDDATTTTTTTAAESDEATDVAVPEDLGPHAVGRRTIEVVDAERDRTLNVDIWYPADDASAEDASFTRYSFLPTAYFDSEVAKDEPEVDGDGPFPLLVYSHGNGGISYASSFNMEHLASYGFVVAAPDHKGNTAIDRVGGGGDERAVVAYNRPLDVSAVIDEVLARGDGADGPFSGAVDADRIGVMGHSFGGFTALTVAGGFDNEMGTVPADDRVDAIAGLAPYTEIIDDSTLTSIEVPTLLMAGTKDDTTPIDPQTERPWGLIPAEPAYRVDLTDAGHQTLTDVCDYAEDIPALPDAPEVVIDVIEELAASGCGDGYMDHGRAKDLINIYTTAFFLTEVAGDDTYADVLTEDYAAGSDDLAFQAHTGN